MSNRIKQLRQITSGTPTADGNGVRLTRLIGNNELNVLDPFLLLDVIESDESQDYIGGFPEHPHRGFETVTYLLNGQMFHKDSTGREGVIESGGVQWMTAGKGILHSEMPQQENGLLHGFQLWINLPAKEKMQVPSYQEFSIEEIPLEYLDNGSVVRVVTGQTDKGTTGPIVNVHVRPVFLDVSLQGEDVFRQTVSSIDNTFIYVIEGDLSVGAPPRKLGQRQLGILYEGDLVIVKTDRKSRFLFVSAQPINEPIARGGPFVMNTREEVLKAFDDYRNNQLVDN